MSKAGKRVKSGSGQGGAKWEQPLLAASLNEENWKSNVTFAVGNKPDDYTWIDILGSTVAAGSRRLFSVISKEQLEAEVKELGNPKGKKPKEIPQHFEVCEPCKVHLDNGEDIPLSLLARLLKFKLLSIKANDLRRREAEKKAADGKERGKSAKGGKDKPKSAGKGKGGGKKTPEPPSAKEGSKLRKRGEEDDEGKYIDDEPDDGAQHYIIVYGYHHPHLISQLSELGINVESIIKISSQDYSRFEKPDDVPDVEKDEKTLALEEIERQQKSRLKKELRLFWKDILLLLQKNIDGSSMHNVARKDYEVKTLIIPENLEDAEQKASLGTALFEDIACMIYDLIDAKRQYLTYLDSLKLMHVPVPGEPAQAQEEKPVSAAPTPQQAAPSIPSIPPDQLELRAEVDMRYYNDLMNCIPMESVSIPLMMHCMLEQVEATEENKDPPSDQLPSRRKDGLNSDLAAHISSMAFKLALSEEEHNMLSDIFDLPDRPPETPNLPILMNIHDDISVRTNHLKTIYDFNPQEVEKEMLRKLPFQTLLNLPRPTSSLAKERAARLQELIHFCATGGLSQSEIDRAFKQFVFESMDLASTDPNGFLITRDSEGLEHSAIPWDDPYPFFKGMIPKHERAQKEDIMLTPSDERSAGATVTINVVKWSDLEMIDYVLPDTPSPAPVTPSPPSSPTSDRQARSKKKKTKSAASPIPDDELKQMEKSPEGSENRSRPSTADSKKGILRDSSRSSSAGKVRSRSNSVHFEKDDQGHPVRHVEKGNEEVTEEEPDKTTEESLHEIVDAQKRNLDQWCFAEHYEPHILLQVLKDASYNLPFIDTYYNKRDHSMMVVLHNPYNMEFQNHVDWHTELHCNLGFRNFLEYIEESISDWIKEEEAKYRAHLLNKELDKMRSDEDLAAKAAEKAAKGKKSPRKSPSRSKSPKGSRSSSQDRASSASDNMFIRANSLKAWKEEQDRLKAEEEEKERAQSAKRARSAQKRAEKEAEKEKKRPGSRGSGKSKSSKERETEPQEPPPDEAVAPPERYWPFTGYDVGNKLIHVSGITTSMFPVDGGQIRTERTEFVQGTTSVKSTLLKDGHIFSIHILDPKDMTEESDTEDDLPSKPEGSEKAEFEKSEKEEGETEGNRKPESVKSENGKQSVSAFGSITAQLMDGMCLSLSQFGCTGDSIDGKKYEPQPYIPPPSTPQPGPPPSPAKSKKGDKGKGAPTPEPPPPTSPQGEEEKEQEEKKDEEKPIQQPFQQLYVSCPDGLNVKYFLESSLGMKPVAEDDRRLLVRQSYPYKTKGEQDCEAVRRKYALTESSRIMTSEGTVIKNMMDGNIEVLYADGTVSIHTGPWHIPHSRSNSPQRGGSARSQTGEEVSTPTKVGKVSDRSNKAKGKQLLEKDDNTEEEEKKGNWTTTYPSGEKVLYRGDGGMEELKSVMISVASDPETNQTMATRDDHVITVSYPDGTTIVEHSDGTRITTYYRENLVNGEEEQETDVPKDYETQTVKFVKVECPAYATVEFNCATSENLTIFGNGSTINVFPDGYYMLHHFDGGRCEVDTEGTVTYYPRPDKITEQLLPERELQYVLRHNADVILETVDPDGNVFNVKSTGDFSVLPVNVDDMSDVSNEEQQKAEKKLTTYKEHAPRFLVIHGDGSGTELLRYQDVAEYLTNAEQSPATAVLKDDLPNYPGVTGITILKPYLGGPSDRWLKKYDQESIIPRGIRCRDLTTLPPKEFKTPGPKFGTNVGQGLSVGGAVKQPIRIPILKCPDTLELRQLIQYKPVSTTLREKLQGGLKEYAEYVTERNKIADYMQVVDPRTDEERIHASDLQEIGLQQARDKNYASANMKDLYEKATAPPVPSPPPTPQPKRTQADWDRDQREVAEELAGRESLKKKKIPSYFDSEFGKAFLLSQAKDVDEILRQLSEDPRKDGTEAVRGQSSGQSGQQFSPVTSAYPARSLAAVTSVQSDRSSESPVDTIPPKQVPDTPLSYAVYTETVPSRSGVRPGNPTPAHAQGQGSPAPIRPQNPTPVHAGKEKTGRPINPTPKHAGGGMDSPSDLPSQLDYPAIIMEQPLEEEGEGEDEDAELTLTRSLKVNVLGQPRKKPVPLPTGIKGGRPGAIPNTKYISVEDPVRRKVNNSLIAGASIKGQNQLSHMSGLILFPEEVDFGVLKEGFTYSYTVYLKNTGVDSCRFRIKQPPPATGLRILYKPGPIAAGMRAELNVEVYAIAVGVEGEMGVGSVRHDLEIVTQTDVLFLPITATVLTAHEYDHRSPNSPKGGKSNGAKLVSTKPPSTTGIIRPRKNPFGVGSTPSTSSYIR